MDSCAEAGCRRRRLTEIRCLDHALEDDLAAATRSWILGEPVDLEGMEISASSLQKLLAAITKANTENHPAPLRPGRRAEIWNEINFERATFVDGANFEKVIFKGEARFDHAKFLGRADFAEAKFCEHADFDNAWFGAEAIFRRVTFDEHAGFEGARFEAAASFASAVFRSYVDLEQTRFADIANMKEASFQFARRLGPFEVAQQLHLDECEFAERATIEVEAEGLSASAAIFADGVRLLVGKAEMKLDCVDFGRAATLSGLSGHLADSQESDSDSAPRLLSLHGAQVSTLAVSGIDLSDCRFFGAHGLETMIIEPSCIWRHTPRQRRVIDRQMIYEELDWRASHELQRRAEGWREAQVWTKGLRAPPPAGGPEDGRGLVPMELAALYRALRQAREDNKDQAGAGDLYYGEMEMRRTSALPRGRGRIRAICDRSIITAYWLLSGYGLKASRALLAWSTLTMIAALALVRWGMRPTPSLGRAALFATESTSSLIRPAHLPEPYVLAASGEVIQVVLRLAGPILVGLFLLALRARVKR